MGLNTDCRMTATVPRVLVVDDEPQLLRGMRIILRSAGYAVETARTASEALTILTKRPPDVIVLDLILPDGEGAEVCREVRRCSKLPILILSAAGEHRDVVRALDAGADDYLAKPFGGHELLARLRGPCDGQLTVGGARRLRSARW
jgi:two-component system, OmpR family, KDP operon response regulator KdpE